MRLRPFEQKDIPLILEWMTDPDTSCFFRFDPAAADERSVARFVGAARAGEAALRPLLSCENALGFSVSPSCASGTDASAPGSGSARCAAGLALFADSAPPDLHLACVDGADEYLGTVSLKAIDFSDRNAEFATSFRACARGKGAAGFAARAIMRLGFGPLGLSRIYLNVLAENTRARAFYEKLGFTPEGTFRRHLFLRGGAHDLCWYGLLKEEFKE